MTSEGCPRPPDPRGRAAEPLGCDDDEGEREGDGNGRVPRGQRVAGTRCDAEIGAGEDVVLEDLGRDVRADDGSEGAPGEGGSASRGGDKGDEEAGCDHDGHGHDARDECGEGFVAARGAHRAFHEDGVEDLPGRGCEGDVADEHREQQAGGDAADASGQLEPVPGVGHESTRPGPVRRKRVGGCGAGGACSGAALGRGRAVLSGRAARGIGGCRRALAGARRARAFGVGLVDGGVGGQSGVGVVHGVLRSCRWRIPSPL